MRTVAFSAATHQRNVIARCVAAADTIVLGGLHFSHGLLIRVSPECPVFGVASSENADSCRMWHARQLAHQCPARVNGITVVDATHSRFMLSVASKYFVAGTTPFRVEFLVDDSGENQHVTISSKKWNADKEVVASAKGDDFASFFGPWPIQPAQAPTKNLLVGPACLQGGSFATCIQKIDPSQFTTLQDLMLLLSHVLIVTLQVATSLALLSIESVGAMVDGLLRHAGVAPLLQATVNRLLSMLPTAPNRVLSIDPLCGAVVAATNAVKGLLDAVENHGDTRELHQTLCTLATTVLPEKLAAVCPSTDGGDDNFRALKRFQEYFPIEEGSSTAPIKNKRASLSPTSRASIFASDVIPGVKICLRRTVAACQSGVWGLTHLSSTVSLDCNTAMQDNVPRMFPVHSPDYLFALCYHADELRLLHHRVWHLRCTYDLPVCRYHGTQVQFFSN